MRVVALLSVRNEAAFLVEWLAHHLASGITDFVVASNDCEDGTDVMLDTLQAAGILTHLRNPPPHSGGVQFAALKRAAQHEKVTGADWIIALDIDEFLNIHVGQNQVSDLIAALPDVTAFALPWRLFGASGLARYADLPVSEQFTRAAPEVMYWPWRAFMFKTLYRNDGTYTKPGIHRPRAPDRARLSQAVWSDGAGRRLDDRFAATARVFLPFGRPQYRLAQINHYAVQSIESFLLKSARGRAVHSDGEIDADYWLDRNWNSVSDMTISALATRRAAWQEKLLEIQPMRELHSQAVLWRKQRFVKLMEDDVARSLYGRLLAAPEPRPLTLPEAELLHSLAKVSPKRPD